MSGVAKSSKKSKEIQIAKPVAAENVSIRFDPGPNFKAVSACISMDESSVYTGRKEIWLLQLPKEVNLQELQGIRAEMDDAMPNASSGTLGRLNTKDGSHYSLVQESGAFSDQLFIASAKGLLPVSKRITLEREAEAPAAAAAVKRSLVEEGQEDGDDDDGDEDLPEKKLKKSENKDNGSEKKKKKKKDKKKVRKER